MSSSDMVATKDCPFCGETIKAFAIRCKHCHADLTAAMPMAIPAANPEHDGAVRTPPIRSEQVLPLLTNLAGKSLVIYDENAPGGTGRYRLLETVRQYARDRLLEANEGEPTRIYHRDWFANWAESVMAGLTGPESGAASWQRFEADVPNLRAALEWSLSSPNEHSFQSALQMLRPLATFWRMRGNVHEGREAYTSILSFIREDAETSPSRARLAREALNIAGHLANRQGDFPAASALFEEALHLAWAHGDSEAAAQASNNLGYVALYQGDLAAARAHHEQALQTYQASDDALGIGSALFGLAHVADAAGQYDQARSHYETAMAVWGDHAEGQNGVRYALLNLGHIAARTGDLAQAHSHYQDSLGHFVQVGDRRGIAQALEGFASLAAREGEGAGRATHLYGAAERLRETIGTPLPAVAHALHDEPMNAACAVMGKNAFAAAWAAGRAMPLEQAIACALLNENAAPPTGE